MQKLIIAAIGLSILFSVTVTPVYAWKNPLDFPGKSEKDKYFSKELDTIDEQIWILHENTKLMEFIDLNMEQQDIEVISINITENNEVLASYYVHRGVDGTATITTESDSSDWVFMPTVKQTNTGLKILQSKKLSTGAIIKCIFLWWSVDNDGVPSLYTIMSKADWIDQFLPKWFD
jgi:dsDNA-binding SOS-regulon protein